MKVPHTLFIGKTLQYFDALPSTNEYLVEKIKTTTLEEGTVVFTANQFAGKGQASNRWESTPNQNIAMSILLKPSFLAIHAQFYLNIVAALAVKNTIEPLVKNIPVQIKWPNDILLNSKKTCGILIQNTLNGGHIANSVVGIGVNINQTIFNPSLPNATSLALESEQTFDIELIATAICQQLEHYYLLLKIGQQSYLKTTYFASLYRFETWAWYKKNLADSEPFLGKIVDITTTGALVLALENGQAIFDLKQIQFL